MYKIFITITTFILSTYCATGTYLSIGLNIDYCFNGKIAINPKIGYGAIIMNEDYSFRNLAEVNVEFINIQNTLHCMSVNLRGGYFINRFPIGGSIGLFQVLGSNQSGTVMQGFAGSLVGVNGYMLTYPGRKIPLFLIGGRFEYLIGSMFSVEHGYKIEKWNKP
jgi:hypothetical protein